MSFSIHSCTVHKWASQSCFQLYRCGMMVSRRRLRTGWSIVDMSVLLPTSADVVRTCTMHPTWSAPGKELTVLCTRLSSPGRMINSTSGMEQTVAVPAHIRRWEETREIGINISLVLITAEYYARIPYCRLVYYLDWNPVHIDCPLIVFFLCRIFGHTAMYNSTVVCFLSNSA